MTTTIEAVEASLRAAGIADVHRSGRISASGCVVHIDAYGKAQIEVEAGDADPDRLARALRYY